MFLRILQSETYEILDCLFYDPCTGSTIGDNWYEFNANGTLSIDSSGLTIDGTAGAESIYANLHGTSTGSESQIRDYIAPYCVEFDVVSISGTCAFSSNVAGNQNNRAMGFVTDGDSLKIINDGTSIISYLNGSDIPADTYARSTGGEKVGVGLRAAAGGILKFKNFKIYPI